MRHFYHFTFSPRGRGEQVEQLGQFKALGVEAEVVPLPGDHVLLVFDLEEGHPRFAEVQALCQAWDGSVHMAYTEFTKAERDASAWFGFSAHRSGYPQPDRDFGYVAATYDLSAACEVCSVGLVQRAPFRMKHEPRWGRRSIMQLNWVFDAFFVTPELWERVFAPCGISCRPVWGRPGTPLSTVVQLVVEEQVSMATQGYPVEHCARCGRDKCKPIGRGYLPHVTPQPRGAIARTKETFGSGMSAHHQVIVSRQLMEDIVGAGARGADFYPVAPDGVPTGAVPGPPG